MSAEVLGLKAPPLTPRELFEGNVHYEIPPYQRPYVWDEDRQWARCGPDVVRVAESVALAIETGEEPKVPHHFLDAVVYERKPPVVGDVTRFPVVDGQQRMTTLQVLLDAVQQVFAECGHTEMADDLERLIVNAPAKFKGEPGLPTSCTFRGLTLARETSSQKPGTQRRWCEERSSEPDMSA